jgi:hypothetical protein
MTAEGGLAEAYRRSISGTAFPRDPSPGVDRGRVRRRKGKVKFCKEPDARSVDRASGGYHSGDATSVAMAGMNGESAAC